MSETFSRYQKARERRLENPDISEPAKPDKQKGKVFDRFHKMLQEAIFYHDLPESTKKQLQIKAKHSGFLLQFDHDDWVQVDISKGSFQTNELTANQIENLTNELRQADRFGHYQYTDISDTVSEQDKFIVDDALIYNLIDIPQWDLDNVRYALNQYQQLIQQGLKALQVDYEVCIYVRIGNEGITKKYKDEEFFEKLEGFGDALNNELVELIQTYCQMDDSDSWYHHPEATFLCYPMHYLVRQGEEYLPLYQQYLASVDMDHDVYNGEEILPVILNNNSWSETKLKFVISLNASGWATLLRFAARVLGRRRQS